jgi:pilus assembly protein Flp/PilA
MMMLQSLVSPFRHFLRDEEGATAIEYALIAAGIAAAIISTVFSLGTRVSGMYGSVSSALPN